MFRSNFFERKANGFDIMKNIRQRKDYKNPAIYACLVETFKIDEKESNFDKNIFDPHQFSKDDHFDALGDYQVKKMQDGQKKGGNIQAIRPHAAETCQKKGR
jgi:hypothetical protein